MKAADLGPLERGAGANSCLTETKGQVRGTRGF